MAAKKIINDESGQAIFEMIVFLPFVILLFTLIVTVGNSINGSINQQKATRAYFYFALAGDSIGAPSEDLIQFRGEGIENVGFYAYGWKEREEGSSPFGTCYKMNKFLGTAGNEDCDNPINGQNFSDFIRVFTAYGICTGFLSLNGASFELIRRNGSAQGCMVQ